MLTSTEATDTGNQRRITEAMDPGITLETWIRMTNMTLCMHVIYRFDLHRQSTSNIFFKK